MVARDPAVLEPISHRRVWSLAAPVILSNLSVPLLGAVDTAVMGHLPDPAYIGAVAVGALIFSYLYWGFGFLRMGTTGVVAQAHGARDADEVRTLLARAAILALVLGLGLLLLQAPIIWAATRLLEASAGVEALAVRYFSIRIWGAPATLLVYVTIGWLFGRQRMLAALALTVAMNGLNIGLDLWFVVGLGWSIEGVAAATLISEWSAAALGLLLVASELRRLGGAWQPARILDRGRMLALIRINADIFVRTLCLLSAFAVFTATGARMNDLVLAANAVLLNFQTFMSYALDGFAHAAEALVGSAVGGRSPRELRHVVRISSIWAAVFAALFAGGYWLFGTGIIALLTSIEAVRQTAGVYLPWVVALPLLSVWSYQLDGIFIGATRGPEMRNGMLISFAAFLAAAWLLVPALGNHGLWLALSIFMVVRAAALALWYPRIERAAGAI